MDPFLTRLTWLVLICGVCAAGASVTGSRSKDIPQTENEVMKKKHDRFYKSLTDTERVWILRLVLKQEAQRVNGGMPVFMPMPKESVSGDGVGQGRFIGAVKPADEFSLVPPQLFDLMLNGDVSEKFGRDLIKWLRKEYGIEDEEFAQFTTRTEQICHNGKCWDLGDIGSECCPF